MNLHPLVQRLIDRHGATLLMPELLAAWLVHSGEHVLFFSGDTVRFPEALDVAAVLPELQAAFTGRFDIGVVAPEHEDVMARRLGVQRWPALVFMRGDGYLATLCGMQNWSDYLAQIARVLDGPVTRAPTVGIPVVAALPATP